MSWIACSERMPENDRLLTIARLRTQLVEAQRELETWKLSASMACETPPDGCDCAGCRFAQEHHAANTHTSKVEALP